MLNAMEGRSEDDRAWFYDIDSWKIHDDSQKSQMHAKSQESFRVNVLPMHFMNDYPWSTPIRITPGYPKFPSIPKDRVPSANFEERKGRTTTAAVTTTQPPNHANTVSHLHPGLRLILGFQPFPTSIPCTKRSSSQKGWWGAQIFCVICACNALWNPSSCVSSANSPG